MRIIVSLRIRHFELRARRAVTAPMAVTRPVIECAITAAVMVSVAAAMLSCGTACTSRASTGAGPCVRLPTAAVGASSGATEIGGHLRDGSGTAVVGAQVALAGALQASRITDITGGYRFHVSPGAYTVSATGECSFASASVVASASGVPVVVDFTTAITGGCSVATRASLAPTASQFTLVRDGVALGQTAVSLSAQPDAASAVARLRDIAAELAVPTCSLTIAGNPAIERIAAVGAPGVVTPPAGSDPGAAEWLAVTTAIAVDAAVVRFEGRLAADASAETINRFLSAGRAFTADEQAELWP